MLPALLISVLADGHQWPGPWTAPISNRPRASLRNRVSKTQSARGSTEAACQFGLAAQSAECPIVCGRVLAHGHQGATPFRSIKPPMEYVFQGTRSPSPQEPSPRRQPFAGATARGVAATCSVRDGVTGSANLPALTHFQFENRIGIAEVGALPTPSARLRPLTYSGRRLPRRNPGRRRANLYFTTGLRLGKPILFLRSW